MHMQRHPLNVWPIWACDEEVVFGAVTCTALMTGVSHCHVSDIVTVSGLAPVGAHSIYCSICRITGVERRPSIC